jgi:hypothetical protein
MGGDINITGTASILMKHDTPKRKEKAWLYLNTTHKYLPECSKVIFPGQNLFSNILFLNSCASNSHGSYVSQHIDNFKSIK